jgi:hypothetical protein
MESVLSQILSVYFVLLCLGISAATFVCRKIIEFILDNPKVSASKTSKFWTELFLPIFPVLFGGLYGYWDKSFVFTATATSSSQRFLFGLVAGLLSGLVYKVIKGLIYSKLNLKEEATADVKPAEEKPVEAQETGSKE